MNDQPIPPPARYIFLRGVCLRLGETLEAHIENCNSRAIGDIINGSGRLVYNIHWEGDTTVRYVVLIWNRVQASHITLPNQDPTWVLDERTMHLGQLLRGMWMVCRLLVF